MRLIDTDKLKFQSNAQHLKEYINKQDIDDAPTVDINEYFDGAVAQMIVLKRDHRHNFIKDSAEEDAWKIGIEDCIDILLSVIPQNHKGEMSTVKSGETCKKCDDVINFLCKWVCGKDGICKGNGCAFIKGIKALPSVTPQPKSEDCISRQQALKALDTWDKFGYVPQYDLMRISKDDKYIPYITYDDVVDCIKALPYVTPQTKRGKWIVSDTKEEGYDIGGYITWCIQIRCSNCHFIKTAIEGHTGQYNFCPNCGSYNADMRESEDEKRE